MDNQLFSYQLRQWLKGREPRTLESLFEAFGEKGFAVVFVVLLFVPALPLPTGGITHIFEVIAMLLAVEVILGRKTIWLPSQWQRISLTKLAESNVTEKLVGYIRLAENYAKPRLSGLLKNRTFMRLTGFIILFLCIIAFIAPPFSGLDTLPSIAVVLIGLALLFEDAMLYLFGLLAGGVGTGLILALGVALIKSFQWL